MDFAHSERSLDLQRRAREFLIDAVLPVEEQMRLESSVADAAWLPPPGLAELKSQARQAGLWNLFLPDERFGAGYSTLDYAPVAEISGYSPDLMPEAMNCSAPDTGNMELLAMFGTPEQQDQWLRPLLNDEIRSCFSMTEPDVASSDARNVAARIIPDGAGYRVTGRKWWSTGAMSPRCRVSLVLGVSDPEAAGHQRHSVVLVPLDADGVQIHRSTTVFGYEDRAHGGHAEIEFHDVWVPKDNLLGVPGAGFAMAQARLGPGRVHHCMRLLGMAERAIESMCRRADERHAFGGALSEQGVVRDKIAHARMSVDQARMLVLRGAWTMDTHGSKAAAGDIAAMKAVVPGVACQVIDDAIQVHGGKGLSADTTLAAHYAYARSLRLADGPDEVHRRTIGSAELRRYRNR